MQELLLYSILTIDSWANDLPTVCSLMISFVLIGVFIAFLAVVCVQSWRLTKQLKTMSVGHIDNLRLKRLSIKDVPELKTILFNRFAFMHSDQLVPRVFWQTCTPVLLYVRKLLLACILVFLKD